MSFCCCIRLFRLPKHKGLVKVVVTVYLLPVYALPDVMPMLWKWFKNKWKIIRFDLAPFQRRCYSGSIRNRKNK